MSSQGLAARSDRQWSSSATLGAPALLLAAPAEAQLLRVWPDTTPPCNGTLQACIDGSRPGDGMEIQTDGPIDESISIGRSLALDAGFGFEPLITSGETQQILSLDALGSAAGGESVLIRGLRFVDARIHTMVHQRSGHSITIGDNVFDSDDHNNMSHSTWTRACPSAWSWSATSSRAPVRACSVSRSSRSGSSLPSLGARERGRGVRRPARPLNAAESASQARCPRSSGPLRARTARHPDGSRLRSGLVALLAIGCAALLGIRASAAEVQSTLTVEVTEVPLGIAGIEVGDRYDLHFEIDDEVADTNPAMGAGAFPNLVTSFTATTGPVNVGSWDPSGGSFDGGASNFVSNAFGDNFTLQIRGSGFPSAGAPFFDFDLRFVWPSGIVESSPGDTFASQLGVAPGALDLAGASLFGAIRFQVGQDFLEVLVEVAEPFAELLVWPGPSPCHGSLATCIAAAPPGGTVEIASDGPIDAGFVSIEKSLTVRAGAGFEPILAPFSSFFAGPLGAGDHHVRFEGLRFQNGSIRVFQNAPGALEVAIVDNAFEASPNGGPAITISANTATGPVAFAIENNRLVVPDSGSDSQGIVAFSGGAASMEGVIRGNRITMGSNTQGAAIGLPNDTSAVAVDVFGNVIDGFGYQEGISVSSFGAGSVAARIAGNVVSGAAGEGSREAITVYASMGAIEALIVNNTLAENHTAIGIGGRPDLGGSFDGLVANNAIVGNARGLNVDPGAGTIPDRNNLYFDNTHDLGDGETPVLPGPDSIFGMDPLFVASSDFRPDPASPLVDAGDTSAVPPDLVSDVTGGPRIRGGIVDIGAHEVPEPSGPLAAVAVAAALAALARRAGGDIREGRREA